MSLAALSLYPAGRLQCRSAVDFVTSLIMPTSTPSADATLSDWLSYLETLHPIAIDMGLARITEVAQRLELTLPCVRITVGGTNGKGSTCAMLEAIYLAAGYRVGDRKSTRLNSSHV